MNIRITATIKDICEDKNCISINVKQDFDDPIIRLLLPQLYTSILKSMRDTDEDAFDEAMTRFIDEDYDRIIAKVEKELHHEN